MGSSFQQNRRLILDVGANKRTRINADSHGFKQYICVQFSELWICEKGSVKE